MRTASLPTAEPSKLIMQRKSGVNGHICPVCTRANTGERERAQIWLVQLADCVCTGSRRSKTEHHIGQSTTVHVVYTKHVQAHLLIGLCGYYPCCDSIACSDAVRGGTLCAVWCVRRVCSHASKPARVCLQVYYQCMFWRSGFTHIIQLWHDGAAAPHLEPKQVAYLFRVAQWLQDVHVASGVTPVFNCGVNLARCSPLNRRVAWMQQQRRHHEDSSAFSQQRRQIDWRLWLVGASWA